jgi:uncharacterized protein
VTVFMLLLLFLATAAQAKEFPKLTGRVVDNANLLSPADEAELTGKLDALEKKSSRQLVVATVPSLGGYEIEDYGYRLGRAWGLGQKEADNGAILLVAPNERRVRVEVGYGLEGILTDAFSNRVVEDVIVPRFKANDYPGGIKAGTDALIAQLQAPPEVAERAAVEAAQARVQQGPRQTRSFNPAPLIVPGLIILFVLLSFARRGGGRRYHGKRRRGGVDPWIVLWGLNELSRASRHGSGGWGGGGGFGGFGGGGGGGFGGFSGGGGSFGGGGASGSW